jgi:hypothetical protein
VILNRESPPTPPPDEGPATLPEVASTLRRARTRLGVGLAEAATATSIPYSQIDALEGGTVDRLADRVETLQALRHYADFLGLPGDRYALLLIDLWPSASVNRSLAEALSATSATLAAPSAPSDPTTGSVQVLDPPTEAVAAESVDRFFVTQTSMAASGGTFGNTAPVPSALLDTGETPAVSRPNKMRRRRRGQFVLRLAVWTLGILVVLGAAGLAADHWRPHWLTSLHIPGVHTTGDTSTPTTTSSHTSSTAPPIYSVATTSPTAVTVTVRAPSFTVVVSPYGGPSWVEATEPDHFGAIFAATMPAGAVQKFPVTTGLTLQIGSASGRTLVTVDNKVVGFYFPKAAPTTITYVKGS